ncbi:MAG TPA: DUF1345 domain-containing protein [Acetobacteraceae bacterium]|nr:DUF1345 domain-containing protein [Acetobacteraceae bacterium]
MHRTAPIRRIGRIVSGRPRLFIGAAGGLVSLPVLPAAFSETTRAILAWDVGVLIYLALSALLFTRERSDRMEADAEAQEEGEWTMFALTMAAVVFSFAAILGEFAGTKDMPPTSRTLHIALVAVTLFISWLMTHVTFAFRYAHEYYARDVDAARIDGGLEFPGSDRPDYLDFVYFSLVLGMTFQVSDVQIKARKLRRLATLHGLLSFLFNTIILALTVNIAAGLV